MANNETKTIISLCPFQTQLIVQIPLTKGQIVTGPVPSPQILKVQCDREKCQLWCAASAVCSVSVIPAVPVAVSCLSDDLESAIRDMNATLEGIGDHIKSWLPTP